MPKSRGEMIAETIKRNALIAKAKKEEFSRILQVVKFVLYTSVMVCVATWSAAIIVVWICWPILKLTWGM